jgi:6-phosphogluconate dehydrogenase
MQLISEIYDLLKRGMGLNNDELHDIFKQWNEGEMRSYLVEITRDVFAQQDSETGNRLVDMILDKAGSKGTGKWTSQDAMDLPVSIPTIDMAVAMRDLSSYKDDRTAAFEVYKNNVGTITLGKDEVIQLAHDALYFATLICYAQGLSMLYKASGELKMDIPLADVVKIWRGGCIIRSVLLEDFYQAYKNNQSLSNILLDASIASLALKKQSNARTFVSLAIDSHIAAGGLASTIAYFDAFTTEKMPVNLIQAQRDYFGAHTYERIDKPGKFHTEWKSEEGQ